MRVLGYFPLANGLLAGRYDEDNLPPFPKSLTMKKCAPPNQPSKSCRKFAVDPEDQL